MIEQLRYSWSRQGLVGLGKWQPVAASRGLIDTASRQHARVVKLCRYERPTRDGKLPVSFGWLDSGSERYVFRREFLVDDQAGHPGNFAAHVLVGPIKELPFERCLGLFGSTLWWRGPADDATVGEIPQFTPDDLEPGAEASVSNSDVEVALLTGLLQDSQHLQLAAGPEDVIAALKAIHRLVPELVDGKSVSTYEAPATAGWFGVCGTTADPSTPVNPGAASEARSVARLLLAADSTTAPIAKELWAGIRSTTGTRVKIFRHLVNALAAGFSGTGAELPDILPALGSPEAADLVLGFAGVRRAVAHALVHDLTSESGTMRSAVVRRLRASANTIERGRWESLDAAVLTELAGQMPDQGLATDLDGLGGSNALSRIATQQLRAADGRAPARWPAPMLAAALANSAGITPGEYATIVATLAPQHASWLRRTDLARRQRRDLLWSYLEAGNVAGVTMIEQVEDEFQDLAIKYPEVCARAIRSTRSNARSRLSGLVQRELARYARENGRLPAAYVALLAESLAGASVTAAQMHSLVEIATSARTPEPEWGELVTAVIRRHAQYVLAKPEAPHPEDLDSLFRGARGQAMRDLATCVDQLVDPRVLLARLPEADATLVGRLLFDRLVATKDLAPGQVGALFLMQADLIGRTAAVQAILTASIRGMRVYRKFETCQAFLRYAGDALEPDDLGEERSIFSRTALRHDSPRVLAATAFELLNTNHRAAAAALLNDLRGQSREKRYWTRALEGR